VGIASLALAVGGGLALTGTAEAAGKQCGSCHKPQGPAFAALNNCTRCHEGLKVKEVNADAGG